MKISISVITFILALVCGGGIRAAEAKADVRRTWIETGTVRDGHPGLTVHAEVDLADVKGKFIGCQAMFYSRPGGWSLRDKNGKYRLSPSLNYVAAFEYFRPETNRVSGRDIAIFIPIEELHLNTGHKYRVYVQLSLYANPGKNGIFLAESDFYPVVIDMTNPSALRSLDDTMPVVSVEQAKADAKDVKLRAMTPVDKAKKEPKKKKDKKKKEKKNDKSAKVKTRGSDVEKDIIDPSIFWEKEEVDSAALPKLYIE